jgi:PRTRC genetic system protein C
MKIEQLIREFRYNGVVLADPNAAFSLPQVRDFYATTYPEIVNADIEGPEQIGAKAIYTFRRAVGTKGIGGAATLSVHVVAAAADSFPADLGNRRFNVVALAPANSELARLTRDLTEALHASWMLQGDAEFIKDLDETLRNVGPQVVSNAARQRLTALHREYCDRKAA